MKKVVIIDGFGYIFKAYYAFINRPLTNKNGENTSAIHGFFKSILSILINEQPDFFLVALEGEGKCFRNEIYPDYKANREPPPDDLKAQIPKIIRLLEQLGIPCLYKKGYEADDIIGTFTQLCISEENKTAIIFTSDKDIRQLVSDKIIISHPERLSDDYKKYDVQAIYEKMGIMPNQVIDYLALTGDASDNIPGVIGIGPKTAVQLLNDWKTLDNIYANLDKIVSKTTKKRLFESKEIAYLSQKLATIIVDIPIEVQWDTLKSKPLLLENARDSLQADNLRSVIESIQKYNQKTFGIDNNSLFASINQKPEIQTDDEEKININQSSRSYQVITQLNELDDKIQKIKKLGHFCFDLETTGFDFLGNQIICASFAIENDVFILPFKLSETQQSILNIQTDHDYRIQIIEKLKIIFEDKNILKIGHNLKFDIKFLTTNNIKTKGNLFDTMLAEYCLDASHNILNMDDLADKYLSYKTIHYEDVVGNPKKATLLDIPLEKLVEYSGQDAYVTYQLYKVFLNKLTSNKEAHDLFYNIEMPLLKVLIDMEYYGVSIHPEYLHTLSGNLAAELNDITVKIFDLAGEEINPNSPKQIAEILFNKFKLPVIKKTKTGPSTDVEVLKKLSYIHPLAGLLLNYRTISKIKSTYSDSLPEMINKISGKIHTTYLQTGTQTGRLSSKNPNLQNIPVRTDIGKKIRTAFIPSPGNLLISADYSQIELFLLAEFSKDPNLYQAFKTGEDIHTKTAGIIFNKNVAEITEKERSIGKTINFSILYGQGSFSLSENLEISRKEAATFIELYFATYTGVKDYMEKLKEKCRQTGYAQTFWGRRRSIPEIFDRNKMQIANGERMAVNTTIQGTAADLIKISMIKIWNAFNQEKLNSKIIMQVHDELIFDIVPVEKDRAITIIKECMENGYNFTLQLKTSLTSGNNWGEL